MDSVIEDVKIRKILDSRGNATVEVDITTGNGFGRAAAPSGASTGAREVAAFPEGVDDLIQDFKEEVASELFGIDTADTQLVDSIMKEADGTDNLSSLGGNITVAVSLAAAKAAASSYNLPLYRFLGGNLINELPYPLGNMINGGAHAGKKAPDTGISSGSCWST